MNDEQMIWESYEKILLTEGKIEIIFFDEDSDDYDPWEISDKAEAMFKRAGLNLPRHKDLKFVAMDGEEVVGATFNSLEETKDSLDYGGSEDEPAWIYEFDIAVDPKHQGGTVGYLLTKECVNDAEANYDGDIPLIMYNRVINPKMAQMLERLFGFEFMSEDRPDGGYIAQMTKFIGK